MGAEASFDEMAVALSIASNKLTLDIEEKRIMGMRLGMTDEAIRIVTTEMQVDIDLVRKAQELLKHLAPHETEIRKIATRGKPMLVWERARAMVSML